MKKNLRHTSTSRKKSRSQLEIMKKIKASWKKFKANLWDAISPMKIHSPFELYALQSKLQMTLVKCALWLDTFSCFFLSLLWAFFWLLTSGWFTLVAWMPWYAHKCWIYPTGTKAFTQEVFCFVAFPTFNPQLKNFLCIDIFLFPHKTRFFLSFTAINKCSKIQNSRSFGAGFSSK